MVDEKCKQLAMKVKMLRAERGLTQEQLAEKSGVSVGAIFYIEKDCQKKPRVEMLMKLAKALEVAPEELLQYIA